MMAGGTRRQMHRYATKVLTGVFLLTPSEKAHSQQKQRRGNGISIGSNLSFRSKNGKNDWGQGTYQSCPRFSRCDSTRDVSTSSKRHSFRGSMSN